MNVNKQCSGFDMWISEERLEEKIVRDMKENLEGKFDMANGKERPGRKVIRKAGRDSSQGYVVRNVQKGKLCDNVEGKIEGERWNVPKVS